MSIHLQIITPEKVIYSNDVDEVTAPTTEGHITVLPNHVGLFTRVEPGELVVRKDGKPEFLAITGGFLEVSKKEVTILADYAVKSEEIELEKAIEAQKRAAQLLKEAGEKTSQRDLALAEGEMRKAILELKVANRRKRRV